MTEDAVIKIQPTAVRYAYTLYEIVTKVVNLLSLPPDSSFFAFGDHVWQHIEAPNEPSV